MMRGNMASWFVPSLVAFILVMALAFVAAMFFGLTAIFAFGGSWTKLAQAYPAGADAEVGACHRQTIRVGAVRYRQAARVCVLEQGLYIRVPLPFHRSVLIPWDAFTGTRETTIYGRAGMLLNVGTPHITTLSVRPELFQQMRPHLPPPLDN